MSDRKNILLIATGGTIASKKSDNGLKPQISPEELTERFVRGDASRNTEGSGLGLAIARSFTEVQGGTMKIEVEGDLFRVILRWKLKDGSEEPEETIQEGSVQEKLVQEEPEADDLDTSDQ